VISNYTHIVAAVPSVIKEGGRKEGGNRGEEEEEKEPTVAKSNRALAHTPSERRRGTRKKGGKVLYPSLSCLSMRRRRGDTFKEGKRGSETVCPSSQSYVYSPLFSSEGCPKRRGERKEIWRKKGGEEGRSDTSHLSQFPFSIAEGGEERGRERREKHLGGGRRKW